MKYPPGSPAWARCGLVLGVLARAMTGLALCWFALMDALSGESWTMAVPMLFAAVVVVTAKRIMGEAEYWSEKFVDANAGVAGWDAGRLRLMYRISIIFTVAASVVYFAIYALPTLVRGG